jgi:3-oxoacyl-[acyl-carrier protein] reductase
MDDTNFTGQRVLVVGGSSGIGNGIAQAFRIRGAEVHVWGTRARAEDYAGVEGSELDGLSYACVDVGDPDAIAAAPAPARSGQAGPDDAGLDVLVLCQGTVVYRRGEFERAGWDKVMAVNLDSLMHCCRRFKPALAAHGVDRPGRIIIVSSVAGLGANKGNPAYAASKAGAISLTRTLGQAWAPEGVRVNGLAPGLVDTKLTKVTTEHPQRLAGALAAIPAGRLGQPADMAGAALFLASPLAAYVNGQTLVVDGGLTL